MKVVSIRPRISSSKMTMPIPMRFLWIDQIHQNLNHSFNLECYPMKNSKVSKHFSTLTMKRTSPFLTVCQSRSLHIQFLFSLTDVIHCVRDLKQILRNPLVIRHDNIQVTRRQRTFVPKRMVNKKNP